VRPDEARLRSASCTVAVPISPSASIGAGCALDLCGHDVLRSHAVILAGEIGCQPREHSPDVGVVDPLASPSERTSAAFDVGRCRRSNDKSRIDARTAPTISDANRML